MPACVGTTTSNSGTAAGWEPAGAESEAAGGAAFRAGAGGRRQGDRRDHHTPKAINKTIGRYSKLTVLPSGSRRFWRSEPG